MKFIPPLEISSKIMTLIEDATKELILISPYVEISKWDKMKKCIERALNRKVNITFIARKNAKQDLSFLEQIGVNLVLIDNLHAKLYLNENYAIVTSQNIVYYSDINSIDIAYQTDTATERTELVEYVNKYIKKINVQREGKTEQIIVKPKVNQIGCLKIIEKSNYDNIRSISSVELDKLSNHFRNKYSNCSFNTTSSYVFSDKLLPFADIMLCGQYIIKFKKSYKDVEKLIEALGTIEFDFTNKTNVTLVVGHKSTYYLEIAPNSRIGFNYLIKDYDMITEKILNNPYIKEISDARSQSGNDTKFFR